MGKKLFDIPLINFDTDFGISSEKDKFSFLTSFHDETIVIMLCM